MQGRWQDVEDHTPLVVEGFDVTYSGMQVAHDFFRIEEKLGALNVTFGVDDPAREGSFMRENLAGLVIDPEGQFHGWNTRFGATFERVGA